MQLNPGIRIARADLGFGPSVLLSTGGTQWIDVTKKCPTIGWWLSGCIDLQELITYEGPMVQECEFSQWLSPSDLQPIKAFGVTYVASLIERLVEELAEGHGHAAGSIRSNLDQNFIQAVRALTPGSLAALKLRSELLEKNQWSQYLEVGLGSDPELFTKCPPMSALGSKAVAGVLVESKWNNPEPEAVLVCNHFGNPVGVTIGNDLNLRDIEGRSSLLLGRAKDNRGSCVIGPWIRIFDSKFTFDHLRDQVITLKVQGNDGFCVSESAPLSGLTRGFKALVRALFDQHDYPDGVFAFTRSPIAPTWDRDVIGGGFTHHIDDQVQIELPCVGVLTHTVKTCDQLDAWSFGITDLMHNLATRGLLR